MEIVKVKNWASVRRGQVFSKLGSSPERWEFNGTFHYGRSKCQLCGTEIVRKYRLENKNISNPDERFLWIGSECVRHFYEVWMPNGLERALELLKRSQRFMRSEQIVKKLEEFRKICSDLVNYLLGEQSYINRVFPNGTRTSKVRASLRRKGYLRHDELSKIYECTGEHNHYGITVSAIAGLQHEELLKFKQTRRGTRSSDIG